MRKRGRRGEARRGLARPGAARRGRQGKARRGGAGRGRARRGEAGGAWRGGAGRGVAGKARRGEAGRGEAGEARLGKAWHGEARQAWRGEAWRCGARLGEAGVEWLGKSGRGVAGEAGRGEARQGVAGVEWRYNVKGKPSMRLLVSGGAGFIGSHVVHHALDAGHEVHAVDNLATGDRAWVPHRAHFHEKNIGGRGMAALMSAVKPEAVIHLAALADLRGNWTAIEARDRVFSENFHATRMLLEAMPSVPFVLASTASVYGAAHDRGPVSETDAYPWTCESPYACSKFACEALAAAYSFRHTFPWYSARFVNVVGARSTHGVIGDAIRALQTTGKFHAADDGKQTKSIVHVADVAEALLHLVTTRPASGAYNVTSAERWSWRDYLRVAGVPDADITCEDRAGGAIGDPIDLYVSGAKLARAGYTCARPVRAGVEDALAHLGWTKPNEETT